MSLITCPDCSTEISDSAFKCTKCGVTLRKPVRSIGGKIIKWGFVLFNLFMALWMWGGMQNASEMQAGMEGAEAVGAAIGTGIGAALIGGVWFGGFVILGILLLVTRPTPGS